jgi:hypothetical protein
MNARLPSQSQLDAERWLADGPTTAPLGLLARALTRTATTAQRPGWLATLLGASVIPGSGHGAQVMNRRAVWLAGAIALLLLAAILVVAGAVSQRDQPVVVVSSPSAGPASMPPPTRPATGQIPCFMGTQVACAPSVQDVVDPTLGFSFAGGAGWSNLPTDSPSVRHFGAGSCWDGICRGGYITVTVFAVGAELGVTSDPTPSGSTVHLISGTTLAEIAAAWAKAYPDTKRESTMVADVPAIVVRTDSNLYVIAIKGNRIYSISSAGPAFVPQNPRLHLVDDHVLSGFLAGFQFLDVSPSASIP